MSRGLAVLLVLAGCVAGVGAVAPAPLPEIPAEVRIVIFTHEKGRFTHRGHRVIHLPAAPAAGLVLEGLAGSRSIRAAVVRWDCVAQRYVIDGQFDFPPTLEKRPGWDGWQWELVD